MEVIRFSFVGRFGNGAQTVNDLHYYHLGTFTMTEEDCSALAADINGHLGQLYINLMESSWTLDQAVVRTEVIPPAVAVAGSATIGAPGAWTTSPRQNPHAMCLIVRKDTGVASRSGRGWISLPGSPLSTDFSQDVWDQGYVDAVKLFAAKLPDTIIGSPSGTSWFPCVYSRTRHKRGNDPFFFDLDKAVVSNKVHWQRTRLTIP